MHVSRFWRRRAPLEVLGLDPYKKHSTSDIKDAFHEKAKRLHPDAGGDAESFKELNSAYESLRKERPSPSAQSSSWDPHRPSGTPNYSSYSGGFSSDGTSSQSRSGRRQGVHYERYNVGGERRTWDYGDGRTYANQSTSNFYRPYKRNYADPQGTGFTPEELRQARFATFRTAMWRLAFNIVLYGVFFYLLFGLIRDLQRRRERPRRDRWGFPDPSRPSTIDDEEDAYWRERARREHRVKQMTPNLQEHWTDEEKTNYLRQWNATLFERELRASRGEDTASAMQARGSAAAHPSGGPRQYTVLSGARVTRPRQTRAKEDDLAKSANARPLPQDAGAEMDDD